MMSLPDNDYIAGHPFTGAPGLLCGLSAHVYWCPTAGPNVPPAGYYAGWWPAFYRCCMILLPTALLAAIVTQVPDVSLESIFSRYGIFVLIIYILIREVTPVVLRIYQENSTAGRVAKAKQDEHLQALESREAAALERIAQSMEVTSRAIVEQRALLEQVATRLTHLESQHEQVISTLAVLADRKGRPSASQSARVQ